MSPPAFTIEKMPTVYDTHVDTSALNPEPPKKSHVKLIAASILFASLILVGGAIGAVYLNNTLKRKPDFDTTSLIDGRRVPEHVRVDFQNEVIYVSNKQDGDIDGLLALHAYDRGMLAFKDLTNNKCYIDRLDETFQEGLKFWQSQAGKDRAPKVQYFRYIHEPIDGDVLRIFGGKMVAEHCQDVASHWIVPLPEQATAEDRYQYMNKTAEFICRPRGRVVDDRRPLALEPSSLRN